MKALVVTGLLASASIAAAQTAPLLPSQPPVSSTEVAAPVVAQPIPAARPRTKPHRRMPPSPAELRVRAANRAATLEPVAAGYVNAVQVYPFSDGAVFRVLTAPGQVTDIALQPGEALGAVAAGDTVRWVIGDTTSGSGEGKRTHVLVKPFAAGLATNIIITTDRRTYHLALSSAERSAMVALSWTYPQDQLIALKAAEDRTRAAQPVATGVSVDQLHFDYVISGDQPVWRPLRAFDDGRQTFIEFPAGLGTGEAPPLFLVDGTGTAQLVNYRVQGRYYVVDRLFEAAELRLGLKRQDVVRITRSGETNSRRRAS
ncbi:P-type conjugative transfer protein TrbG [Sphingopyxis sp. MC1]|uniref:P-type conjugative transfer protein TrbG n=1 Tax=Sphingopyxis sp. MC1 TaxID=1174684 RepID=UPI0002D1EF36|nr:P-type conjugative transfer protein TrbG [Sphingopyxis sp. MC1]ENY82793.1 P-type conjugative transfer protein TrbG [Sphingopyxis sp. MC1]MBN2973529.1 P-type conjugative transfer protein TrbG [Roseomonas aeriglobus]